MKVLNFGSLNYDYVYQVEHMVAVGETLASSSMATHLGGKGLNQSIALARAGIPVYHAGCIGEEGDLFLEICKQEGIYTECIRKVQGKSGHTIIQVDENAQNCILLYGGSNRAQTKEHIDEVISKFHPGDMIILQNEINLLDYIIEKAYEHGMTIVLNPSPFDKNLNPCDLTKVRYFLLNEIEGEQLTGQKEPNDILDSMKEKYPNAKIVLTLGREGAVYQENGKRIKQKVFKVKAVDTTAAGDTFTGYFIAGVMKDLPMEKVIQNSAKASAIAVSRVGAVHSIPTEKEVEEASLSIQ